MKKEFSTNDIKDIKFLFNFFIFMLSFIAIIMPICMNSHEWLNYYDSSVPVCENCLIKFESDICINCGSSIKEVGLMKPVSEVNNANYSSGCFYFADRYETYDQYMQSYNNYFIMECFFYICLFIVLCYTIGLFILVFDRKTRKGVVNVI